MPQDQLFTWGPDNVANLLTTTLMKRPKKELQNAIFDKIPTFEYLNSKGRVNVDGGTSIGVPLEVAQNDQASFYDGYDPLSIASVEFSTTAQFKWKQAAVPVSVSGRETNIQNRGESQLINLVMAKQKNAEKSLRDLLNRKAHSTGNSAKELTSLVTLIDATSTIGDINSTTHAYWQSFVKAGGSFAAQGIADWRNTYNNLMNRGANTDMIITTLAIHEAYEATLLPQYRYTDFRTGDAKFKDLVFGNAKVRFDKDCAAGVSYFLDSDVLHLYVSEGENFTYLEWVRPPEQNAKTTQFVVGLELGTSNRRFLGKVTGQS